MRMKANEISLDNYNENHAWHNIKGDNNIDKRKE